MAKFKRIFIIVLDSCGIGNAPDAADFGDEGSFTLRSCAESKNFNMPNMKKMGLFNIDGVGFYGKEPAPLAAVARLTEASAGKDTTIGHWEMAGIISKTPFPVYPDGFPKEVIKSFENETGRRVICNKPFSGTQVIEKYGEEHLKTGSLIVYTSADSVFQIAAHTDIVPLEKLYEYCRTARKILSGKNAVARVIARPFTGTVGNFKRTADRRDFSLEPPKNMLDYLTENSLKVISVGKIKDIFASRGISDFAITHSNAEGISVTAEKLKSDFTGLCFTNLVDFDMLYGHRNDVDGYALALSEFDRRLPEITEKMGEDDLLMITADHGCDPLTPSTDHSRECVPLVIYGKKLKPVNLGTLPTYAVIAKTVLENFKIKNDIECESILEKI